MKKRFDSEFITYIVSNTPYIDDKGNICYVQGNKVCLSVNSKDKEQIKLKRVSKNYYFMNKIYDDHYVVCDVMMVQNSVNNEEFDNSKLAFKFGVIALERNSKGDIIPMAEKVIVPMVYDDMSIGNLKTMIGLVDEHCTYIDIDKDSKNYGKQLVPVILEYALPFSIKHKGFAECSIDGVAGYLPRDSKLNNALSLSDLLTEEEVEDIRLNRHTIKVKKIGTRF